MLLTPQRELISNVVPEVDLAKHRRQSPSPLWFTSCYEHGSCEIILKHMCKHCKKSGTRNWDKKERECGKTLFVSPDFKLGYCVSKNNSKDMFDTIRWAIRQRIRKKMEIVGMTGGLGPRWLWCLHACLPVRASQGHLFALTILQITHWTVSYLLSSLGWHNQKHFWYWVLKVPIAWGGLQFFRMDYSWYVSNL